MVDVLILNYNDFETTKRLVNQIISYKSIKRICVVDNASTDGSYEKLKEFENSKVKILNSGKNGGYGYGNNFGIKYLTKADSSKYILLCNPDVIITDDAILALEKFLKENEEYIIAAPFMLDNNGKKQSNTAFPIKGCLKYILSTGMITSKFIKSDKYPGIDKRSDDHIDVGAVAGSLFLFDTEKMLRCGMYDENIFLYCEERVLGIKCERAGYKIALLPNVSYIHNHSVSIDKTLKSEIAKRKIMNKSRLYVIKKYYNSNFLTRTFAKLFFDLSIFELLILSIIRSK